MPMTIRNKKRNLVKKRITKPKKVRNLKEEIENLNKIYKKKIKNIKDKDTRKNIKGFMDKTYKEFKEKGAHLFSMYNKLESKEARFVLKRVLQQMIKDQRIIYKDLILQIDNKVITNTKSFKMWFDHVNKKGRFIEKGQIFQNILRTLLEKRDIKEIETDLASFVKKDKKGNIKLIE